MSELDQWADQNFCRIFELPLQYPTDFCFGGGDPTTFKMVDWFNPIPTESTGLRFDTWAECEVGLREFLCKKNYVQPGRQYLCITDFGKSFIFTSEG